MIPGAPTAYKNRITTGRAFWLVQDALLFLGAFAWLWFWRPYGFFGGDSEYLDRQIAQGLFFRKREPMATASMQIANQMLGPLFGFPTAWSISFQSCLWGALTAVVLLHLCRGYDKPFQRLGLMLASGYALLLHGHVEAYALPTLALALWLLVVQKVDAGKWGSGLFAIAYALFLWSHTLALCFLPVLMLQAWLYRSQWRVQKKVWLAGMLACFGLYVFTDILKIGHGPGFETLFQFSPFASSEKLGGLFSMDQIKLKAGFWWMGTHMTLIPALLLASRRGWSHVTQQWIGLSLCAMLLFVLLHPDAGELDWDLFMIPSLPLAVMGAHEVMQSRWKTAFSLVWLAAFASIWVVVVLPWANLPMRGLASVRLEGMDRPGRLMLDDRYALEGSTFYVQGGCHWISRLNPGERTRWRVFCIQPGEDITLKAPEMTLPIQ